MLNGIVCAGVFMADYPCYACKRPPEEENVDCYCDCHELHVEPEKRGKFDDKPYPPCDVKIVGKLIGGERQ